MGDSPRTPIDWHEVHRRIAAVQAAIGERSRRERLHMLELRARALARQPESTAGDRAVLEVVVFRLGGETYALEITHVREVHPLRGLTPLPGVPPFVAGLVNVRGEILSVVDLRDFFGLPAGETTDRNRVIVLEDEDIVFVLGGVHAAPEFVATGP